MTQSTPTESHHTDFFTDVATVAKSLEQTLHDLRLSTNAFPDLEQVLVEQLKPEAIQSDLLNQTEFITLAGDYLRLVPLDVSIGWTTDAKAQTRGPHEALRNQYVGTKMWGQQRWSQFYNDPVRQSIDATIAKLEATLNSFGTIFANQASASLPNETRIPIGGINASYIGSLRVQAYRNAGLRLYEDPERMFTLAFRALATKRGWLTKTPQGQYQLAKNGEELIAELHTAQLTEQQFEQYTGTRITLDPPIIPAVTQPRITGGTPATEQNAQSTPTNYNTIIVKARTWAQGKHDLHEQCSRVPNPHPTYPLENGTVLFRPLTIQESAEDCIIDSERHEGDITKSPTWNTFKDSCTSIIYGDNGRFKIQIVSPHLLRLPQEYNQATFQADYNALRGDDVVELNRNEANVKYNTSLTFDEEFNHPFWMTVIPDNHIRRRFSELQRAHKAAGYTARAVYVNTSSNIGEGRAVFVSNPNNYSNAVGNVLSNYSSFLRRVAQ